jgi:hypothetical protein
MKKLEGERGYLALEDLRVKFKFSRSNMPIREVGRSRERKNPRGRRKKKKKPREGRVGARLKHHHDAIDLSAKLGANDPGAMLGAKVIGAMLAAKVIGAMMIATSSPHLCRHLRQPTTLSPKIMAVIGVELRV